MIEDFMLPINGNMLKRVKTPHGVMQFFSVKHNVAPVYSHYTQSQRHMI